jgi:hypothetical protein
VISPFPDFDALERSLEMGKLEGADLDKFRDMRLKHLYGYLKPEQWQEFWELEHRYETINLAKDKSHGVENS